MLLDGTFLNDWKEQFENPPELDFVFFERDGGIFVGADDSGPSSGIRLCAMNEVDLSNLSFDVEYLLIPLLCGDIIRIQIRWPFNKATAGIEFVQVTKTMHPA